MKTSNKSDKVGKIHPVSILLSFFSPGPKRDVVQDASDTDEDEEDTVYECPGLAPVRANILSFRFY